MFRTSTPENKLPAKHCYQTPNKKKPNSDHVLITWLSKIISKRFIQRFIFYGYFCFDRVYHQGRKNWMRESKLFRISLFPLIFIQGDFPKGDSLSLAIQYVRGLNSDEWDTGSCASQTRLLQLFPHCVGREGYAEGDQLETCVLKCLC